MKVFTNIDQIHFGNTALNKGTQSYFVHVVADTIGNNVHYVSGGSNGPTTYTLDLKGSTKATLNFDTQKLANFVNDITLPDQSIETARLAMNLSLNAAGAAAGCIPVVGSAIAGGFAASQTLFNYAFDQMQVEAQKEAARQAVKDYDSSAWGEIIQPNRDLIVIQDFQIGVDNIVLPSVQNAQGIGYAIKQGFWNNQGGVFIEVQNGLSETSNLAFINNKYQSFGLDNGEFEDLISNLFNGGTITTINQTPIYGENQLGSSIEIIGQGRATYATDYIEARGGNDQVFGYYGDDMIKGGQDNDTLYGGFNGTPDAVPFNYQNDGLDILEGGAGNDTLYGGSGNDILHGEEALPVTIYEHGAYQGIAQTLSAGDYNTNQLAIGDNRLSSFKISAGVKVTLYEHANFTGASYTYTQTGYVDAAFNDKTSSIRVQYIDYSGSSDDLLNGGEGDDLLTGGLGNDTLTGGTGNDKFIFNNLSEGIDHITDFAPLIDDIQINKAGFGATSLSQVSYNSSNGALSFNNQQFAVLDNLPTGFNVANDLVLV